MFSFNGPEVTNTSREWDLLLKERDRMLKQKISQVNAELLDVNMKELCLLLHECQDLALGTQPDLHRELVAMLHTTEAYLEGRSGALDTEEPPQRRVSLDTRAAEVSVDNAEELLDTRACPNEPDVFEKLLQPVKPNIPPPPPLMLLPRNKHVKFSSPAEFLPSSPNNGLSREDEEISSPAKGAQAALPSSPVSVLSPTHRENVASPRPGAKLSPTRGLSPRHKKSTSPTKIKRLSSPKHLCGLKRQLGSPTSSPSKRLIPTPTPRSSIQPTAHEDNASGQDKPRLSGAREKLALRHHLVGGREKLRRVPGMERSPGGTPHHKQRASLLRDPTDIMRVALREKFKNVHGEGSPTSQGDID